MSLSLRDGRRGCTTLVVAVAALASSALGCPGPEPSATGSGAGGDDLPSVSSSGSGSPSSSGSGPSSASVGSSGKGSGPGGTGGEGAGMVVGTGAGEPVGTGGEGGRGGAGEGGGVDCGELLGTPEHCGRCDRPCSEEGVESVDCQLGRCKPICAHGFSDLVPDDGEVDDGCEARWRRVFVTEDPVPVPFLVDGMNDLEGAAAADAICQQLADGLDGEWRAWVSDFVLPSPAVRFDPSEVPYMLLDGTVVAQSFEDLLDNGPEVAIDRTEKDTALWDIDPEALQFFVWTGTDAAGDGFGPHCEGWTNGSEQPKNVGRIGIIGDLEAMEQPPEAWTESGTPLQCATEDVRLYCFEQ